MAIDSPSKETSVLKAFDNLPRGSQLLLCYSLYNDLEELQMMIRDNDFLPLVKLGWLTAMPRMHEIHGMRTFKFDESVYDELLEQSDEIFSRFTAEDLEHYKKSKRAYYPWLW